MMTDTDKQKAEREELLTELERAEATVARIASLVRKARDNGRPGHGTH